MKKVLFLPAFFLITPIIIIFSAFFLTYLTYSESQTKVLGAKTQELAPLAKNTTHVDLVKKDERTTVLGNFLEKYDSPLKFYTTEIIEAADKYGLDWRLLPAIAMQESTLCNNLPERYSDTYNCWGFGIYGTKVTRFSNYEDAIETVSRSLAINYIAHGLDTPEEIMTKYTPSSNGSWAESVAYVMSRLQTTL